MTMMWFLLAPIAILLARYFKFLYLWFWIHFSFFGIVIVYTLDSITKTYDYNESPSDLLYDEERWHSRIGFTIAGLILTQAISGILTRFLIWQSKA